MLVEHTITRLNDMRLAGMSEAYSWQREKPNTHELSFDERFGMLVDREWAYRVGGGVSPPTSDTTVRAVRHTAVHETLGILRVEIHQAQ